MVKCHSVMHQLHLCTALHVVTSWKTVTSVIILTISNTSQQVYHNIKENISEIKSDALIWKPNIDIFHHVIVSCIKFWHGAALFFIFIFFLRILLIFVNCSVRNNVLLVNESWFLFK
jgi:hypothetical protein